MITRLLLLQGYILCLLVRNFAHAFPSLLVESASGCMTEFAPDEVIMNNGVLAYKDSPHPDVKIVVQQNDEWKSGPIIVDSEDLPLAVTIKLEVPSSLKDVQYAVESNNKGGFFPKQGGCEGKKRAASTVRNDPGIELVVESLPVQLVAAWATGHEAVKLTDTIDFTSRAEVKAKDDEPALSEHDVALKIAEHQRVEAVEAAKVSALDKKGEDKVEPKVIMTADGEEDHHHFDLPQHHDIPVVDDKHMLNIPKGDLHIPPPRNHRPKKVLKRPHDQTSSEARFGDKKKKHVLHGYHLDEYAPNVDFMRYAYGGIFLVGAMLALLLGLESLSGSKKSKGRRDL